MSEQDITETMKSFYGNYSFPGKRPPDRDGLLLLRKFSECVKQLSAKKDAIRVLDAGCGTGNTTTGLAGKFTHAEFLGVDISDASLKIAAESAEKAGIHNVKFMRQNLLEKTGGDEKFDIIICMGVLHHTASMLTVLSNLRSLLTDEGVLFLWIYGKHGRYNHSLNMRLLRMLLDATTDEKNETELARQFAENALNGRVLEELAVSYFDRNSEIREQREVFKSPVWIADQFLNPHEILLDLGELLDLTERAGFTLQSLPGFRTDISQMLGSEELAERFRLLSEKEKLIAADLLLKPERYFAVLNKSGEV